MDKFKKKYSIILILIFTLISCKNSKKDKVELVYENGIEKIAIEIENGKDFLIYDQLTKTNFIVNNIDPASLLIVGSGIRILGTDNNNTTVQTEIKVPSDFLDKDTLTIKVRYGEGYKKGPDFQIPMKKPK